jgi:capsular polysaccharide biosynthesis protein
VAEPLSMGRLARVLLRYWLLLLLCTVLGGVAGFVATRFMTPVYTATATQLIKGLPGTGPAANYEAAQYAVSRAKSYPSFVYSSPVLEGVRSDMGNQESVTDLRNDLSASNPVDTPLLQISAVGRTREEARDKANSAARHMARFITQIETVAGKSPISVETAVQGELPANATSPKTLLIAALGAIVGFAVATGLALGLAYARSANPRRAKRGGPEFDWNMLEDFQNSDAAESRYITNGEAPSAESVSRAEERPDLGKASASRGRSDT